MGLLNLHKVKKKHIAFLQEELKNTADDVTKVYLKNMIKSIKNEFGVNERVYLIDNSIVKKLKPFMPLLGINELYIEIVAALLCNGSVGASKLATETKHDRAAAYRVLNRLVDEQIAGIVEGKAKQYYLLNRENPFEFFITKNIKKLKSLENFKTPEAIKVEV